MGGMHNGKEISDAVVLNIKTLGAHKVIDGFRVPFSSCSSQSAMVKPGAALSLVFDSEHNIHLMLF